MKPGSAVVVGGSLGGLIAANLLHQAGWDVTLYEKAKGGLAGRGAGLVAHPELFRILGLAGIDVDAIEGLGVPVTRRIALDQAGRIVGELACPQMLTSWNRLYDALDGIFPRERHLSGMAVAGVGHLGTLAEVRLAGGSTRTADLIVAADGARSTIREQLFPEARARYAGYVAWRGLVDESEISAAGLESLFPHFTFSVVAQGQIAAYPVAGLDGSTAPGRRRYNLVWYRATPEAELRDILTDEAGGHWPDGIPPPLIRPSVQARMREAAGRELPPQLAKAVGRAPSLFFQPIADLKSERLVAGRAVLAGDSAFVARPHSGMGVTKAAQDACQLLTSLSRFDDLDAALSDYQARRIEFGNRAVDVGRQLGAYMEARNGSRPRNRMAERYSDPGHVLADTAMPLPCAYTD